MKAAGKKALKAIVIMEVAQAKDHLYISEIKQEIESHWNYANMLVFI